MCYGHFCNFSSIMYIKEYLKVTKRRSHRANNQPRFELIDTIIKSGHVHFIHYFHFLFDLTFISIFSF